MKQKYTYLSLLVLFICLASNRSFTKETAQQHADAWQNTIGWWNATDIPKFDTSKITRQLSLVKVQGNKFVTDKGDVIVFRGVSIADPDKLVNEKHFTRHHFEIIKAWGANVVRIPVHPPIWQKRGKSDYLQILDQIITWSNELGLYVIVDWHSIGNLKSEMFQAPHYHTTKAETFDFLRTVSSRYKGINAVAMYEIFNEPTVFRGQLGILSWADWKEINEEAITIIQANNPAAISLVAGFDWAYDLTPVATTPIERENVAYVSHPYPMKVQAPFEKNWEHDWGFVADKYPVITTEIGYELATDKGAHVPVIDDGSYGKRITDYLGSKGISWVAWVFDPDWAPQMIEDWNYKPTMQGKHFREVMLKENKQ